LAGLRWGGVGDSRGLLSTAALLLVLAISAASCDASPRSKLQDTPQDTLQDGFWTGQWTAEVRLENGERMTFDHIQASVHRETLSGSYQENGHSAGTVDGTTDGTNLEFAIFEIQRVAGLMDNYGASQRFDFEGRVDGDMASGTVVFKDEYDEIFEGTFTMVPYGYKRAAPEPKDPGGTGRSSVIGSWAGECHTLSLVIPLTMELALDGRRLSGSGTFEGETMEVSDGFAAGTAFALVFGSQKGFHVTVHGQAVRENMRAVAFFYQGTQYLDSCRFELQR
jgi:hypothetical protein